MASPRSPERGRPELALAQEGKTSEVSEDFGSLAAEITVRNLRVRPTLPFAGTSVPAEGVLHFVAAMLQSQTLEDGLRVVLDALIGDNAIQAGLWVWPEPAMVAIGLIGTARLYEVRSHELASVPPSQEILVEWTQRARPVEWTPRSVRPETNGPGGPFYITSPLGTVGAICLPSTTPPLSTDEQHCTAPGWSGSPRANRHSGTPNSNPSPSSQLGPATRSTTRSARSSEDPSCCSGRRPTRSAAAGWRPSGARPCAFAT